MQSIQVIRAGYIPLMLWENKAESEGFVYYDDLFKSISREFPLTLVNLVIFFNPVAKVTLRFSWNNALWDIEYTERYTWCVSDFSLPFPGVTVVIFLNGLPLLLVVRDLLGKHASPRRNVNSVFLVCFQCGFIEFLLHVAVNFNYLIYLFTYLFFIYLFIFCMYRISVFIDHDFNLLIFYLCSCLRTFFYINILTSKINHKQEGYYKKKSSRIEPEALLPLFFFSFFSFFKRETGIASFFELQDPPSQS